MTTDPIQPVIKPTMYCRKCSYILDGLDNSRCPECGRVFDPTDKRTYRKRPRPATWKRRLRYAVVTVLVTICVTIVLPLAILTSSFALRYWSEQEAITVINDLGGNADSGAYTELFNPMWLGVGGVHRWAIVQTVHSVGLDGTSVQDQHLKHLRGLTNLAQLDLSNTQITDAGLAHLKGLPRLYRLDLSNTQITDAGLVHLKGLPRLQHLYLSNTQITDAGLVHLKGRPLLFTLSLANTQITGAGLAHLKRPIALHTLDLSNTQITDNDLVHLKGLPKLRYLDLANTQVSAAAKTELQQAVPRLRYDRP